MALILKDRVKESSSSSGTGNITLGGAFPGYQTFNTAIASGSTVYYTIHNLSAGFDTEWEVGVGTFTSPATLVRNTVLSSSTGSLINFTAGTEGLEVFVTQPAEEAVYINQATGLVEAFGNGTNTISFTDINTANLTANTVTLTAGTITTNAANATDITNKTYVDGLFSQSISYHEAVLVESPNTAGNLDAVYVQPNGAGNGVGATLTNNAANVSLVIDGVSVSNTARVLIYNQSNAVQNGVYTVTNPGAPDSPGPGAKWVLTRATDADTFGLADPNALGAGDAFFVQSGNTGAGETYVCNTQGTITFGSSNITFAQISSAQIYAAGTGLNLANLTFSIANTAVTAATYGSDGNVAQFTVNAQGQLTNAANVAINASSITTGTLPNAQTTANSANGASTIVLRDTNGSFTANTITATDVNSTNVTATTGSFTNISGNAATVTAINASNISSGTIDNARTTGNTANSASTLVLRDTNGAFEAGNVTAANFIGAGATITSINASNISSGTIANSRTTAASANGASTIVLRDAGGNFSANMITADITGNGAALTAINASNITSGTINNARTTASSANGASTIVLRDANGSFDANVVNATNLSGGGTSITSMNASNLSAGTVASARVSGSYTGITGVGTVTAGTWQGNVIATTYGGTNLSSFTANGVVYASSTSALATGSAFVFNGTNVGIGTSSPSAKLDVRYTSFTPTSSIGSLLVEESTAWAQGIQFYINNAGTFNSSRPTGGIGVANSSSNLLLTAGSLVTNNPDVANGFTATATSSSVYRPNSGAHVWYGDTGLTAGNTFTPTERMRIDSSGNVLVNGTVAATSTGGLTLNNATSGSTATQFALRCSGTANSSGSQISFRGLSSASAETDYGYIAVVADDTVARSASMRFWTTNSATPAERMRITSTGNVGIGTSSPAARLEVAGSSADAEMILRGGASNFGGVLSFYCDIAGGGNYFRSSISGINEASAGSALTFGTTTSGNATPTERMRINRNGAVGIGTASPAATLHVDASGGATVRVTRLGSSATAYGQLENDGTNTTLNSTGATIFGTGATPTERMRITSGGNLLLGLTTGAVTQFTMSGDLSHRDNASGVFNINNYENAALSFSTNNAERARFSAAGGFSVGTTSDPGAGAIYATGNITAFFSDERLKTKTGDIENALDKVCQIETLLYHANETAVELGYDASIQEVGVTAQSVQKVQPEVVVPAPVDAKYLTVRYEKLVPLLIEAIKELKAEVDALKGK